MTSHDQRKRAVIVVCDSLRADLIEASGTPTLHGLKARCANFIHSRGVFPSTTRVSAACMATGCQPAGHGLLGNTMVLDEGDGLTCLSVGKPDFLDRLRSATGRTLHRPTMAERIAPHGASIVMSNVSPGAAYVFDPDGYGYVFHRSGSFGPGRVPLADGLAIEVGAEGDRMMTERFCQTLMGAQAPVLAVLWLSEPDHTAHYTALGSPAHRAAIAPADSCVRRVLDTVDRLDPDGRQILLVACSDHGMETVRRRIDLNAQLVAAGFKQGPDSQDIVVAPNGTSALLHFSAPAWERLPKVAEWLAAQDFTGRVFQGDALVETGLPLTGSLGLAITFATDNDLNEYGIAGGSVAAANPFSSSSAPGCGQHGGFGEHEQRPFLFIKGGEFQAREYSGPASLIDIAPTVLRHLNLPIDGMDGKPLQ
jgi:hypothetical protein